MASIFIPFWIKLIAVSYAVSLFVKNIFFSPHATPNKSAYVLIAEESKIPGRSLLSNINGLSIDPVAIMTFLALNN